MDNGKCVCGAELVKISEGQYQCAKCGMTWYFGKKAVRKKKAKKKEKLPKISKLWESGKWILFGWSPIPLLAVAIELCLGRTWGASPTVAVLAFAGMSSIALFLLACCYSLECGTVGRFLKFGVKGFDNRHAAATIAYRTDTFGNQIIFKGNIREIPTPILKMEVYSYCIYEGSEVIIKVLRNKRLLKKLDKWGGSL